MFGVTLFPTLWDELENPEGDLYQAPRPCDSPLGSPGTWLGVL